ncbi:glycosyltransferase family 2 protein, partial [Treponema pedis]|uniref:glycosyltransferase family 2 protein n=1 Tax=Treponema pedis TaxID=409322 RepID=UPI0004949A02
MLSISVIIATCRRNDLLLQRSLKSVYQQTYDKNVDVIVCVDANDSVIFSEVSKLQQQIKIMRDVESVNSFPTKVIANERTKFHSGTGAWNTAILSVIDFLNQDKNENHYIAILDDDDSWDNEYLENIVNNCPLNTGMVVSGIRYINSDGSTKSIIATELNEEEIFIRNPGIFGSNMFINLNAFLCAGGFDESMQSTTDRDFLMRYIELSKHSKYKTVFCNFTFVNHYADENRKRVTNDIYLKKQGLNIFYYKWQKYINNKELYNQSIIRAKKLFGYNKLELNFFEDDKFI